MTAEEVYADAKSDGAPGSAPAAEDTAAGSGDAAAEEPAPATADAAAPADGGDA